MKNIINDFIGKNKNPEIDAQVEREAQELHIITEHSENTEPSNSSKPLLNKTAVISHFL